jgi:hypothetical protein
MPAMALTSPKNIEAMGQQCPCECGQLVGRRAQSHVGSPAGKAKGVHMGYSCLLFPDPQMEQQLTNQV